jgi:hypothetical protein
MSVCAWVVTLGLLLTPVGYLAVISWPDSTDYFMQEVASAKKGPDGRNYIYVGDELHVTAYNYRHLINGTCVIDVWRGRQNVGGKYDGKRTAFQFVQQAFVGDGKVRKTAWPIVPETIMITEDWFDDPTATEQEMDIFTWGTYNCNILDNVRMQLGFPRVLHDGERNPWREKTRVVLKRKS